MSSIEKRYQQTKSNLSLFLDLLSPSLRLHALVKLMGLDKS